MKMILFFLVFFLISACNKPPLEEPPCTPPPCEDCTDFLKIIWQSPINSDTSFCFSQTPLFFQNQAIFTKRLCNVYETLIVRNLEDGAISWQWEDYDDQGVLGDIAEQIIDGHILVLGHYNEVYGIDLNTQSKLWKVSARPSGDGNPRISEFGSWIFHVHQPPSDDNNFSHLIRINAMTGKYDTIVSIAKKDGFRPDIEPPSGWINPQGDTILIFQNRQVNFNTLQEKVDLYAFNMTQDAFVWKIDSITPTGSSSVRLPIIKDDRIYFQGANTIICIDAPTGDILWQKSPGGSFLICANILVDDKLIVNRDLDDIYALDIHTGDIIWHNPNSGATVDNMVHYKGVVYFGSDGDGKLHAVDVNTGEERWAYDSPNEKDYSKAGFHNGVAINEELGYLYTVDNVFAMCIDLNE